MALMLAAAFCFVGASPAGALDLDPADYFKLSYKPFTFDKTEITGSEAFHVTVAGHITCTQNIPFLMPVREAVVTSQVIARHITSGAEVTLNPSYTINVKPFPDREGDTIEISQTVPLQFTTGATSGNYTVIGQIVEAKVKFIIGSMDITSFLPKEQPMGTVKYTAPDSSSVQVTTTPPAEATPPPEQPIIEETSPPSDSSPTPASETEPVPSPTVTTPAPTTEPEVILPSWGKLLIIVVAAGGIVGVSLWLRHRHK